MRNTVYCPRFVRNFGGNEVLDEPLAHTAPLGWEHIGLTGEHLWSEMDKLREWLRLPRLQPAHCAMLGVRFCTIPSPSPSQPRQLVHDPKNRIPNNTYKNTVVLFMLNYAYDWWIISC
ncbi:MAG: hypothetical protein M3O74_26370 [Pseudomonadota bacterium]|nr:hypothetical protein [Pseudomonadota bacterium]